MTGMEFRVLGSFDVVADGSVTSISAPKQRELLALLLINANTPLSTDRIIDELWGSDDPPGISTVRFHVSKLRKLIGGDPGPLATTESGYRLDLHPDQLDAARFEAEVAAAGDRIDSDPEAATVHIRRAGDLWRGDPYPGAEYQPFAAIEVRRLQELHLVFLSRGVEVELARGRHAEVVPHLEKLVSSHPLHERFWELLMLALYRSGRQAEALRAYGRAKQVLGDELGIDPSSSLSTLEEQILLQAPGISYVSETPTNLPAPPSSFVGRDGELRELRTLCAAERMVTIVGPGGIGKTRLAVEVAHSLRDHFSDGTWFVDLSGTEAGGVARSIMDALPEDEQAGAAPLETAISWLAPRSTQLVVDNCEHVIDDAGDAVARLVMACPRLHVLATSRERLGVDGERTWDVEGLALPDSDDTPDRLLESDAVQLLVDRARRADRTFHFTLEEAPAVGALARALDGIPLAIELAAARLRTSTVTDMQEQLRRGIAPLSDDRRRGPQRHRTMRAALDWSYRLLDAGLAAIWPKLSVFRGGFDQVAAAAVTGNEADEAMLERLVDVSLLGIERRDTGLRYRMLEVIREFAASLLEPAELSALRGAHTDYFDTFAARQAERMNTGERADAIRALRTEHDNLQAAIAAAHAAGSDREVALVANLGAFWFDAGNHDEARAAFTAAIGGRRRRASPELATALEQLVQLYAWSGALDRAHELADQQHAVAGALDDDGARTRVLASKALLGFITGDYRAAIENYEAMLEAPDTRLSATVAYVTASLAYLYTWTGDPVRAEQRFEEALAHADRFGLEERAGMEGDYRGWASFQRGDLQAAAGWWRAGELAYGELGLRPMQADMRQLRAWAMLEAGDAAGALPMIHEATDVMRELALAPYIARGRMLEAAATADSEPAASAEALAEAMRRAHEIRCRPILAWSLWYGASFAAAAGRVDDCLALRSDAERFFAEIPLELPDGFAARDAELLTLTRRRRWSPAEQGFDAAAAWARITG